MTRPMTTSYTENLRTRPGQLYSKANVVRTVRELGQLGFFEAQEISPNFI